MKTTGVYQNYKLIIEKIFNQYSDYVLKSKLLEKFNNYLLSEGFEKKSLKNPSAPHLMNLNEDP